MAALAGNLTSVGSPLQWSLLFARQPEPDLEFTEEELDQTSATRPISPMKRGKKPGGRRPLLWIILLALVGGIAYIAMEPEQATEWLAPFLAETAPPEPPRVAVRPKPAIPVPPSPAAQPEMAPAPPAPVDTAPAPAPLAPTPPAAMAPTPAPLAPASNAMPSPMFAEGQKVTVIANPTIPSEIVSLSLDPTGTKPGPTIRPGVTLNILDGDLQPGGWVYSVRAEDGTKGWINENRLRLKF